ncbi:hypothetical protein ACDA63_11290 [Uliginosibacterium sp. sgz301328]
MLTSSARTWSQSLRPATASVHECSGTITEGFGHRVGVVIAW